MLFLFHLNVIIVRMFLLRLRLLCMIIYMLLLFDTYSRKSNIENLRDFNTEIFFVMTSLRSYSIGTIFLNKIMKHKKLKFIFTFTTYFLVLFYFDYKTVGITRNLKKNILNYKR